MTLTLELQLATDDCAVPAETDLRRWAVAAVGDRKQEAELVVRVVDEAESQALNSTYRGGQQPTNVLSFPFQPPPGIPNAHLGDLVICAPVVAREAREQGKDATAHWAHMLVHGVLHLLGYDHQTEEQAGVMEGVEREVLRELGFADPYQEDEGS